jgi:hypothetical protein
LIGGKAYFNEIIFNAKNAEMIVGEILGRIMFYPGRTILLYEPILRTVSPYVIPVTAHFIAYMEIPAIRENN